MFDFSFYELMVFGIIALIVLGPEKLPQAVRTVGTYYAKFRRTVGTLKAEMEAELDLAETRQKMQEELAKIKQAEAEMQREMEQLRGNMKEFEAQQNSQLQATTQGGAAAATNATQSDEKEWVHPLDKANPNMAAPTAVETDYSYDTQSNTHTSGSEDSVAQVTETSTEQVAHQEQQAAATDSVVEPAMTRPWENMWFLLGAYDKAKRLPPAPLLPNYTANPLLYDTKTAHPSETLDESANSSTAMAAEVKS